MDKTRRRYLKAQGKAEVQRRSAELRATMKAANPADYSDSAWARNYKHSTELERWLRKELPVIHAAELHAKFLIWDRSAQWQPYRGGYIQCEICESVVPSWLPRRWFCWTGCACGNISYRMILWWRRARVRQPAATSAVKLIGRGATPQAKK